VPVVPTQLLFVHVWFEAQAWPQVPQFALLVVTSTHVPLHCIWPATEQLQLPPLQVAPPVHIVQLVPQWAESVSELHELSEHLVVPLGHIELQAPLAHTWPEVQTAQLDPQCVTSDATQAPPQET
jgi:hypothetical protein